MLREEFKTVELQMKQKLAKARARFTHPGDKGTEAEASLRQFLKEYLPRRLSIGHGEVIDRNNRRSKQTDVVIVNEDHPFTFTEDLPGLFFIEGVVGAGEVKSILTSENLERSIANSKVFKTLDIGHSIGATAVFRKSDKERYYRCPPCFLFAYESQLDLQTIHARLVREINEEVGPNCPSTDLLDAVFVLGKGWLINMGDGEGNFQFRDPEDNIVAGWVWKQEDSSLFELTAWLSVVMPRIIRYESILGRYLIHND